MKNYDLIIVGAGSGNAIIDEQFNDWDVAIVERNLFGGTCLNVGCIPSKMLVYTAELAELATQGSRFGLDTSFNGADWPAIRDRVFGRLDPIAESGQQYRSNAPNVTVYDGDAVFVDTKQLEVQGEVITAKHIVLAAGARPVVPEIAGLADCGFHTSNTIMRLDSLPKRLTVIGGGFIAAELGNVFGVLGSEVTFVMRGETMLGVQDEDIASAFTDIYASKFNVLRDASISEVRRQGSEVVVKTDRGDVVGDELLLATGRRPNGDQLCLEAGGIATAKTGHIIADAQRRTNAEGVWALGDVTNLIHLKHVANHDARVVKHNLLNPDNLIEVDHRFIPSAVFGLPQVAGVGMTERQCREAGLAYRVGRSEYRNTAYGWAMEDTTSFCKLIANTETGRLLGAHILGPQASTLISQLIQAMAQDLEVDAIARKQYYIHPALSEVVEQALLELVA